MLIGGQQALVTLEGFRFYPSMLRSKGTYTSMTTLSRSFLLRCNAGTRVKAVLSYGQLNTGPANYNLLSFLVVPYQPRSVAAAAWAVYRSVLDDLLPTLTLSVGVGRTFDPSVCLSAA